MKKKAILGFLTGAAIVAATTGSYAAWDKLTAEGTNTVKLGNPITVTVNNVEIKDNDDTRQLDTAPTYTASVPITTSLDSRDNLKMTLTPIVKEGEVSVDASAYTAKVKKGDVEVLAPVELTTDETNTLYTVEITPTDTSAGEALAGKTLSIGLEAKISTKE